MLLYPELTRFNMELVNAMYGRTVKTGLLWTLLLLVTGWIPPSSADIVFDVFGTFAADCEPPLCNNPDLEAMRGTTFTAMVRIPSSPGPDLLPGDPNRGEYEVSRHRGYFRFDGAGTVFDVDGNVDIRIVVQDCPAGGNCPMKDNYVWIMARHPVNGAQLILYLNGTVDAQGPGPVSDQLPDIALLQRIADYGGGFGIFDGQEELHSMVPAARVHVRDANAAGGAVIPLLDFAGLILLVLLLTMAALGRLRQQSSKEDWGG